MHSTRMRQHLLIAAALATFCICGPAIAQTGPALLVEPFPKEQLIDTRGSYLVLDAGHAKGSSDSARMSFYESTGRVRVVPGSLISPRVGWELEYIDIDLGRGAAGSETDLLPGQLIDHSVGIAFPVAKLDEWILGAALGLGYAGGSPYGEGHAWYGKATAVAFRQLSKKDALVLALDYDGNRTLCPDVPLPGVAYLRQVDDTLSLVVGLPLSSVTWKPFPNFTAEFGWLPIESFHAAVGYELVPHWTVFGSLDHHTAAFFVDGLGENDRLMFQQRRAEVGVRWGPRRSRESFGLTASVGYAWHQEFSVGFDSRKTDEVADFSDEPYVRFGFEVKF
jgi:hypothetical protein